MHWRSEIAIAEAIPAATMSKGGDGAGASKFPTGNSFDELMRLSVALCCKELKPLALGPMVRAEAADLVRRQIEAAVRAGARTLIDAKHFSKDAPGTPYMAPQVVVDVTHQMALMREESFGPVVGIMPVASDEEAVQLMNDSPYGLTASLWTRDAEAAIGAEIETGTVFMNRCDYLDPALARTGVKDTGRGATLSRVGLRDADAPKIPSFPPRLLNSYSSDTHDIDVQLELSDHGPLRSGAQRGSGGGLQDGGDNEAAPGDRSRSLDSRNDRGCAPPCRSAGLGVALFDSVQPNPVARNVTDGVAAYRAGNHDGVIAFGGGSALVCGKVVAFMAGQTQSMWDFEDVGDWWTRANADAIAPIVAVPTTAGTGSEVGRAGVITDEVTHTKKIIFHPQMMPKVVICDPELTVGLPPNMTAGTGMDALAHCLEAYCAPGFRHLGDGIAVEGVRLVRGTCLGRSPTVAASRRAP